METDQRRRAGGPTLPLLPARARLGQVGEEAEGASSEVDLSAERLDVYVGRDDHWNPEHGVVAIPDGWEFLPTGDAFAARQVKAAGVYWMSWQPRSRNQRHRRLLGLSAPAGTIRAAEERAAATEQARQSRRQQGARSRQRAEDRYRKQLREAILAFLDFAPEHADLAEQIAAEAAGHAAVVGSGRVGRTRLLSLDERAVLAARAHIRHRHAGYHDDLDRVPYGGWDDEWLYLKAKSAAQDAVDGFLDEHRRR
jgi:hypothetical protein